MRRCSQHHVAHSKSNVRSVRGPVAIPSQGLRAKFEQDKHHTVDTRYALAVTLAGSLAHLPAQQGWIGQMSLYYHSVTGALEIARI